MFSNPRRSLVAHTLALFVVLTHTAGADIPTAALGEIKRFAGHGAPVLGVAFVPDGQRILSCGGTPGVAAADHSVRLWDVNSGREIFRMDGHTDAVSNVAVSPDGKRALSASHDKTLCLWDLGSGKRLDTLRDHNAAVLDVAFSADGKQALSGSWDFQPIVVWNMAAPKVAGRHFGRGAPVGGVALLPDGRALTAHRDATVRLWIAVNMEHYATITRVAYAPNGLTVATAGEDGVVKVWNLADRDERYVLRGPSEKKVYGVAYSPDNTLLATAGEDQVIRLWDFAHGRELAVLKGHTHTVTDIAFSPDGKLLASASGDATVRLWDVARRAEVAVLARHTNSVNTLAFSPDGGQLVSGGMTLR